MNNTSYIDRKERFAIKEDGNNTKLFESIRRGEYEHYFERSNRRKPFFERFASERPAFRRRKTVSKYRRKPLINTRKHCNLYINETANNTFLIVKGIGRKPKLLISRSCGTSGATGKKRASPYAVSVLSKQVASTARSMGKRTVSIILLSNLVLNMKSVVYSIKSVLRIIEVIERMRIPHNGMRACSPKRR